MSESESTVITFPTLEKEQSHFSHIIKMITVTDVNRSKTQAQLHEAGFLMYAVVADHYWDCGRIIKTHSRESARAHIRERLKKDYPEAAAGEKEVIVLMHERPHAYTTSWVALIRHNKAEISEPLQQAA